MDCDIHYFSALSNPFPHEQHQVKTYNTAQGGGKREELEALNRWRQQSFTWEGGDLQQMLGENCIKILYGASVYPPD